MKNNIEELFGNILRITLAFNEQNQSMLPTYFLCLWKNQPFGNRLNLIAKKLEIQFEKLLYLNDLLKLSIELIQVMSTVCLDIYLFIAYWDLISVSSTVFLLSIYIYISSSNECNSMLKLQKDRKCVAYIIKR
jgi:hypothetical protein